MKRGIGISAATRLWPVSSTCSKIFSVTKQPEAFGRLPDPSGRTNRTAPVGWAVIASHYQFNENIRSRPLPPPVGPVGSVGLDSEMAEMLCLPGGRDRRAES